MTTPMLVEVNITFKFKKGVQLQTRTATFSGVNLDSARIQRDAYLARMKEDGWNVVESSINWIAEG